MNLIEKIYRLWNSYFLTESENALFALFSESPKQSKESDKDLILIQCVEDYFYYSLFGQIIKDVRKTKNIQVEQYVLRNFSVASYSSVQNFLKNKLFINRFMDKKWTNLYSAYCNSVAYSNEQGLGVLNDLKLLITALKIAKTLRSKDELIALKSEGVLIGDLIYDTYLRFKPAPTINLDDFFLIIVIWKTLRNIHISKNYFAEKKPKAILQSYSTYIQHGITIRVALQRGINVYTFSNNQTMAKKLSLGNHTHAANTDQYKNEFEMFNDKEKKHLEAEQALQKRLDGNIDLATAYMKESAYKESVYNLPNVCGAVIVFLHDFYDSPHIYKSMVFADFLDWIEFTITELEKHSIAYYLKPHPNQLPESKDVVNKICKKYSTIKLLSSKITNRQLVNAGMKLGITVYGTIAHELAYMGIPVITCGNNPHSSYNFCFEAKNKNEYASFIKNIDSVTYSDTNNIKKEVTSFYYMHNLNLCADEKQLIDTISKYRQFFGDFELKKIPSLIRFLQEIVNYSSYRKFISKLI